jgi:hypothetical protein
MGNPCLPVDPNIKIKILAGIQAGRSGTSLSQEFKVSLTTISKWKKETGIVRGALVGQVESSMRDSIVETLTRRGVGGKVVKTLTDALEAVRDMVVPSNQTDLTTGEKEPGMIDPDRPDWKARLGAVEQLRKILGLDAPTKTINANINADLKPDMSIYTEQDLDDMAAIERRAMERMNKSEGNLRASPAQAP